MLGGVNEMLVVDVIAGLAYVGGQDDIVEGVSGVGGDD